MTVRHDKRQFDGWCVRCFWAAGVLVAWLGCGLLSGCSAGPGGVADGQNSRASSHGAAERGDAVAARDRAAIRSMGGMFDVMFTVVGGASAGGEVVRAREAVLVEPGERDGQIVLEHLLLVGEPAAVARHWSAVWTPIGEGRWLVVESEADGRPSSMAEGVWVHEALEPAGGGLVSRFVPVSGSVRAVTARSPGLAGGAGEWWASTVVRVGPGSGWTRTTEGQLLGEGGRAQGGSVSRTEAYELAEAGAASALAAAETWWSARADFWSAVRGWWDARSAEKLARVRGSVDGVPMWRAVLDLESAVRRGESAADGATLEAVLGVYVVE